MTCFASVSTCLCIVPLAGPSQLANQWLLSAMVILTSRPRWLRGLFIATGQEELGRYCLRVFKEGNWLNVFVDTRVPYHVVTRQVGGRGEK